MSVSWHVIGLDRVLSKYERIEREFPEKGKKIMTKAVLYAQGQIPSYPAPKSSVYRRTGTLGRTVTAFPGVNGPRNIGGGGGGNNGGQPLTRVESMAGGIRGVIGGRLEYMPLVIGEGEQAYMHEGHWWTLEKVIKDARPGIVKVWRAEVMDWFKE